MAKNPLNYHVAIRLTEADGLRLADLADRLNRDRSELVREIVLAGLKKYGDKGKPT
jgi:predicted DNA-binding protein